jgi:hypothetical protein
MTRSGWGASRRSARPARQVALSGLNIRGAAGTATSRCKVQSLRSRRAAGAGGAPDGKARWGCTACSSRPAALRSAVCPVTIPQWRPRRPPFADALFQSCEASNSDFGGAVYLSSSAKFACTRCEFVGNKAFSGGAVGTDLSSAVIALSQTVFRDNTGTSLFTNNGCGAVIARGGQLTIDRTLFIANSAPNGIVGAIACITCTLTLKNSIVAKSSAVGYGAVYLDIPSIAVIESTTFLDNTVTGGPALVQLGSAISARQTSGKPPLIVRDSILWAPGASPLVGRFPDNTFATLMFSCTIAGDGPQACPAPVCQGDVTTTADPRLVQVTLTRPADAFGRPEVYWAPGLGSPAIGGSGGGGGAAVDLLGNPRVRRETSRASTNA